MSATSEPKRVSMLLKWSSSLVAAVRRQSRDPERSSKPDHVPDRLLVEASPVHAPRAEYGGQIVSAVGRQLHCAAGSQHGRVVRICQYSVVSFAVTATPFLASSIRAPRSCTSVGTSTSPTIVDPLDCRTAGATFFIALRASWRVLRVRSSCAGSCVGSRGSFRGTRS